MSVSSRTVLRPDDLEKIREAQIQAATLPTYRGWVKWMKEHYNYSFAVRAAIYLGLKTPGHDFYRKMKEIGQTLTNTEPTRSVFVEKVDNL